MSYNTTSLLPQPLVPALKEEFENLLYELSPENLTCDGELTRSQVRARRDKIMGTWFRLEKMAGRTVTFTEINQ